MNRLDKLCKKVKQLSKTIYTAIIWPVNSGARLEMQLPDTRINCRFSSIEAAKKEVDRLAAGYGIEDDQLLCITVDYGE